MKSVEAQHRTSGSTRILVLDDEEPIRKVASRILRRGGYEVYDAATAEEARAVLDGIKKSIHLLLCDLALIGLQGREASIMLQAMRPEMRVLYMSGNDEADFRKQIQASTTGFLQKPFGPDELLAAVERALEEELPPA